MEKIRDFGTKITELIQRKDFTREEVRDTFRQVLLNEQPDLQQGAFLAALTAKGETPEEIAGIWEAIYELDTAKVTPTVPQPVVENCGTGMDALKTFNISTAAAIVAAADGVYMSKHGARAITSRCGAIDILESVGVDVECDTEIVKRSIEKAGIGIFNGMSPRIHPALARVLSQIQFGTVLNIAASLANPALPHYGVRGVYSRDLIKPVISAMREIGYRRAIVVHGLNNAGTKGIDEISTMGKTFVNELHENGEITSYTIIPEDIGIQSADEHALLSSSNRKEETLRFLRTLSGTDRSSRYEIVCLNTAPILYLMGKVKDIEEGFDKAKEIIESGRAINKLREWVREQNLNPESGEKKLERLLGEADAK
ncbi:MAG: anthranilate phosphoribosyltransferase [Halobacteriota archaeon]